MKFAVYYKTGGSGSRWARSCEYKEARNGMLKAYPRAFATYEEAERFGKEHYGEGTETKIKEVKG